MARLSRAEKISKKVKKVIAENPGMPRNQAIAIAFSTLRKEGKIRNNTKR